MWKGVLVTSFGRVILLAQTALWRRFQPSSSQQRNHLRTAERLQHVDTMASLSFSAFGFHSEMTDLSPHIHKPAVESGCRNIRKLTRVSQYPHTQLISHSRWLLIVKSVTLHWDINKKDCCYGNKKSVIAMEDKSATSTLEWTWLRGAWREDRRGPRVDKEETRGFSTESSWGRLQLN